MFLFIPFQIFWTFFQSKNITNEYLHRQNEISEQLSQARENKLKAENDLTDLVEKIFVSSETTGKLVSVASLVEFEEKGTAEALPRYNRQRAVTISAALSENYTLTNN